MQAGDRIDFTEPFDPGVNMLLTPEQLAEAKLKFAELKKLLVAKAIQGTGMAKEYPIPEGTVTIGETAYFLDMPDQSYLWVSYYGIVTADPDQEQTGSTVGVTIEEHAPDQTVLQRHSYFQRGDEDIRRRSDFEEDGAVHFCMIDRQKIIAFLQAHPTEENEKALADLFNETYNGRLEEYMGLNSQPVSAEELGRLMELLSETSSTRPESIYA